MVAARNDPQLRLRYRRVHGDGDADRLAVLPDADLEVRELEFSRDCGMHFFQLARDFQHRGVQAKARFHRDDHQVESIGEAPRDAQLAAGDHGGVEA